MTDGANHLAEVRVRRRARVQEPYTEALRALGRIRDAANGTDLSDPTISAIFDIASAALANPTPEPS